MIVSEALSACCNPRTGVMLTSNASGALLLSTSQFSRPANRFSNSCFVLVSNGWSWSITSFLCCFCLVRRSWLSCHHSGSPDVLPFQPDSARSSLSDQLSISAGVVSTYTSLLYIIAQQYGYKRASESMSFRQGTLQFRKRNLSQTL